MINPAVRRESKSVGRYLALVFMFQYCRLSRTCAITRFGASLDRLQGVFFVRPARIEDAPAIAAIQREIWVEDYRPLMREAIDFPPTAELSTVWSGAIEAADSRSRVLIATVQDEVVGFAAISAIDQETDEIDPLHVAKNHRRAGHATRLLTAIADTSREAGVNKLSTWALEGDHPWTGLLHSSGFGLTPDQRTLDLRGDDGLVLIQHRWQTLLFEPTGE